jgi:hypothetical protein
MRCKPVSRVAIGNLQLNLACICECREVTVQVCFARRYLRQNWGLGDTGGGTDGLSDLYISRTITCCWGHGHMWAARRVALGSSVVPTGRKIGAREHPKPLNRSLNFVGFACAHAKAKAISLIRLRTQCSASMARPSASDGNSRKGRADSQSPGAEDQPSGIARRLISG